MSEQESPKVMHMVGLGNAFDDAWNSLARVVHEMALDKGWWDDSEDIKLLRAHINESHPAGTIKPRLLEAVERLAERNEGEMLCLIHSELSEALEGLRHGNPQSEKTPEVSSVEEELADVIIRIMDMARQRCWDVGGAVAAKIQMNAGRAYKHGGKKF